MSGQPFYVDAASQIALMTRTLSRLADEPAELCLESICRCIIKIASEPRTERADLAAEMMRQLGSLRLVAVDILAGDMSRPATGNVRDFTLALVTGAT